MKKYRLLKDLPTFKAGEMFEIDDDGHLRSLEQLQEYKSTGQSIGILAYAKSTLDKLPSILTDWFEEIPEQTKTVFDLEKGDQYYQISGTLISKCEWKNSEGQILRRDVGDIVLTKDEAEKELACLPYCHQDGKMRFATEEDAKESIKKHENEWKTYLGAEE